MECAKGLRKRGLHARGKQIFLAYNCDVQSGFREQSKVVVPVNCYNFIKYSGGKLMATESNVVVSEGIRAHDGSGATVPLP